MKSTAENAQKIAEDGFTAATSAPDRRENQGWFEGAIANLQSIPGMHRLQERLQSHPIARSRRSQPIALISVHGDPAANIGREEAGGQNVYVRCMGEALAKLGWQVDMFARRTRPDQDKIVQHGPHCRTVRLKAGPPEFVPRAQLIDYLPEFLSEFNEFQRKAGSNYPVIHTNYWLSAWVGLQVKAQRHVRLVHTYHSLGAVKYDEVDDLPDTADRRLEIERKILEKADCIVATSDGERRSLRELVSDRGQIEVIPCGTDVRKFKPISKSRSRAKLDLPREGKLVLYAGRFDPRKGIETLVRACAQSEFVSQENFKLAIAGGSQPDRADGRERARIESIAEALGIRDRVMFLGQLDWDRLHLYYCAADVCVIPSHYEPFGLVAIEAMACGTPAIASDVGGLQYTVVHEETGLRVPPRDVVAFSAAIDRVLGSPDWAEQLGKRGAKRVREKFSWKGVSLQLSNLYRRLLIDEVADDRIWEFDLSQLPPNAPPGHPSSSQ